MHAIVACITTGIQFRSGTAPARYCVIARFLKPLWANVYVLSILSLVYYTPIQVDHHRDTRRRRDGVKQLLCLPFPLESKERMVDCWCLKIPLRYN